MASNSLYDDWGWDDAPSQADLDEINAERQQEGPDPFPDEEEFYYANKLKSKYEAKAVPEKPGFLQIWEDATHTTPIPPVPNIPNVVKRSDGYKRPIGEVVDAAKTIAKTPIVPASKTNPYSAVYENLYSQPQPQQQQRPPIPNIPGMVQASQMVTPQPVPTQQAQAYVPPAPLPQAGYVTTTVPLISDYELGRKIIESTPLGNIPDLPRADRLGTTLPIQRPRHKITRQLFLMLNSFDVAYTADLIKLKKGIDKMVESVIPKGDNENEICLYNADEMLRQMIIQMVAVREDQERIIILNGAKRILDMYLPPQVAQKEFIKAQNMTYPHPAYVGIQASLDALNYVYIWTGNMENSGKGSTIITRTIGLYLNKYRGRLNALPGDIGLGKGKTIFYYDFNG
jgi:hypothetical protein